MILDIQKPKRVEQNEQIILIEYDVNGSFIDSDIEIHPDLIEIDLTVTKQKSFQQTIELFGEIDPKKSKYVVDVTFIRFILTKKTPGEWAYLMKTGDVWQLQEKRADANTSSLANTDVGEFFKQLYAGTDEDSRRAMMKSYVESNGTSLSTNWSEVKQNHPNQ